jgi:hypothetical protein
MTVPTTTSYRKRRERRRAARESRLIPLDFEQALREMKQQLALIELRRNLLDPSLDDARAVLGITQRILEAQERD